MEIDISSLRFLFGIHREPGLGERLLATRNQRQNSTADRLRQLRPSIDDPGQVGRSAGIILDKNRKRTGAVAISTYGFRGKIAGFFLHKPCVGVSIPPAATEGTFGKTREKETQ